MAESKSLWELLWDFDPNALVAVDEQMRICVVNPAFCRMFRLDRDQALGRPAAEIMGEVAEFQKVRDAGTGPQSFEKEYPTRDLYVRQVVFPIPAQGIVACILVDLTREWNERQKMLRLRAQTVQHVNEVVDRQMRVAQQIASLLGESTGETKGSLLRLVELIEKGTA